jgi:hypothetical protein
MVRVSFPFLFGRTTVAKQPSGGYTTYYPKHNFLLYLRFSSASLMELRSERTCMAVHRAT